METTPTSGPHENDVPDHADIRTPRREAIVIITATGNPVLEVDPVELVHVGDVASAADPHTLAIFDVSEGIMAENVDTVATSVVWSDTRTPVMIECWSCDAIIALDHAVPNEVPGAEHLVTCTGCAA